MGFSRWILRFSKATSSWVFRASAMVPAVTDPNILPSSPVLTSSVSVNVARLLASSDMLFILPDIRDRLNELLKTWFSRDEAYQSLYDLYFGTVRSPSMYVEHRFTNMFQALESYDRRTFTLESEKMQAHQERLDRIFKSVADDDKEWLERPLRHSHEPSAANRIRRLAKKLDAGWLLSNRDIDLAADLRNYYTHFDTKVEERLPAKEKRALIMSNLAARLRILCELVLLDGIGFSVDDVRSRMEKIRRLDHLLVSLDEE